jgi:hypothetical protein
VVVKKKKKKKVAKKLTAKKNKSKALETLGYDTEKIDINELKNQEAKNSLQEEEKQQQRFMFHDSNVLSSVDEIQEERDDLEIENQQKDQEDHVAQPMRENIIDRVPLNSLGSRDFQFETITDFSSIKKGKKRKHSRSS